MRFLKRFVLSLAVFSLVFAHPGLSAAANPPSIVSGAIDEPIVSSDGNDIQVAHVIVSVPGKASEVKSVNIFITSPTIPGHALGSFSWNPQYGFAELEGPQAGAEYVNLIQPDVNNPDTTSRVIYNQAARTVEIIYRWTLNDVYGSTFNNDLHIALKTRPPVAMEMLMLQPVFADSGLDVDSNFSTNSPPDFDPVNDVEIVAGIDDVEVTLSATDVDNDPITYLMISGPQDATFDVDTFGWVPTVDDIGVENVQFVATDPYGTSTLSFNVVVEDEPIPESGAWSAMSTTGAPDGRSAHSVVWTGADAIVWGGSTVAEGVVGTGGVYNPTNDTWTATAPALNGFATSSHAAVWTGSKMLVWGGMTPTGVTNEGQIYDPATDSWTSMSTVGAPTARYDAAAVWTGSELVVWGGVNINESGVWTWLNDGARYNPTTDTWQALAASSLAGRQAPGAVWVSGKMAVWGGSSWSAQAGNSYYNDGALYDPNTDSWTAMSGVDAPTGRVGHAFDSVIADSLVVWGGQNAAGYLDTGAVYDVLTDTWTTMSMDDAAQARGGTVHGGANGTFIVWGGSGADGVLSTGGIFDQVSNTWTATASLNALSARQLAGAVWMDPGLLVWGGLGAAGAHENTGSIFNP